MDTLNGLLGKFTGWIDRLFGYADALQAGQETTFLGKYGKYLMLALLLLVLSKFAKFNVNLGKGGR